MVKAVRALIGAWARERKRQGLGLFGELRDRAAMYGAVKKAVWELVTGEQCQCECHIHAESGLQGPAGSDTTCK
jgi:hypothetical protein